MKQQKKSIKTTEQLKETIESLSIRNKTKRMNDIDNLIEFFKIDQDPTLTDYFETLTSNLLKILKKSNLIEKLKTIQLIQLISVIFVEQTSFLFEQFHVELSKFILERKNEELSSQAIKAISLLGFLFSFNQNYEVGLECMNFILEQIEEITKTETQNQHIKTIQSLFEGIGLIISSIPSYFIIETKEEFFDRILLSKESKHFPIQTHIKHEHEDANMMLYDYLMNIHLQFLQKDLPDTKIAITENVALLFFIQDSFFEDKKFPTTKTLRKNVLQAIEQSSFIDHKKDRITNQYAKEIRERFNQVLDSIENLIFPSLKITIKSNPIKIKKWHKIIQFNFLKMIFDSGLQFQLENNLFFKQLFDYEILRIKPKEKKILKSYFQENKKILKIKRKTEREKKFQKQNFSTTFY
ncbi:hypothetical protein M0811_08858 [Anaeramoeba ignava]|uniref:Interferon-related developmental regulator N-terminal domain-containing protein n=1 Tax=Anaeramoeba ignava TaxID=1746090 RepID=A0A9Q0LH07_ANAIG|nr:hypothetical protein M0811_08858 [Anaeramoeba ignava]|eukprot:Anaeramoba_ignava/a107435_66.p1 GENE.a107435_66~~a107435_66.p1  ORF type:complete len:410 (+),score=151.46 a107435_66:41-1270(+)